MDAINGHTRKLLMVATPNHENSGQGVGALAPRRQRVVAIFGAHVQVGHAYLHLNLPVRTRGRSRSLITQSVLVTGVPHGVGVSVLDGVLRELAEYFSTGGRRIFRQQVVVALARQVEAR